MASIQGPGTCVSQAHFQDLENREGLLGNSNTCDPVDLEYLRITTHGRVIDEEPERQAG